MDNKIFILILGIFIFFPLISAISVEDVSSLPGEIAPGGTADVFIEVENIFEFDVINVNIKLDLENTPFAPYQSSSEDFVDELDEGDDERFKFTLIVLPETDSGIYKIPYEITYEEVGGNETFTKEGLIGLIVNSEPELRASLESSNVLIKGQENEIEIKIVNSGLSDVKFVYLKSSDTIAIEFLNDKEQYIGDIDSDDFDSVKYIIKLNPNAPKNINLLLFLTYKDPTNKEYSETVTVSLNTYTLKEARESGLVKKPNYIIPIIIVLLVLGYFIRRFIKKRKSGKK